MPSLPIEMPSEMVMVLWTKALPPENPADTTGQNQRFRHLTPTRSPMEAEREFVRAFPGFEREFINVHFARRDHALRRGDAENGLGMILRLEPNGMQNRAAGRAVWTVNKDARKGAQIILFHEAAIVAENLSRGKLRMRVAGARRCGRLNSELQMRVCLDRLSP